MNRVYGWVHPVRRLFQGTQCLGCMKEYHTAAKLKTHLLRSEECRRLLVGSRHNYAPNNFTIQTSLNLPSGKLT